MAIFNWITRPRPRNYGQWRDLERVRGHMENMYNNLAESVGQWRQGAFGVFPLVNVSENADHLFVTAELPGLAPENVELSVKGDSLTLSGERVISLPEGVSYHRREREAGRFSRVVALPVKVEADGAEATFKNGLLKISLPKAAEAKVRPINIVAE